jgi:hypothetical protein
MSLNQIARHGVRQLTGAHQHVDLARRLGEKNGRLSCGVAAADTTTPSRSQSCASMKVAP